nr:clathrin light chain [Quercus suber]
MADRFPSLDDFDAGQTEAQGQSSLDALDSNGPSSFLERERAALGEDAQQFTTAADNTATVADADDDDDDDLLGSSGAAAHTNGNNDMGDFESSFPAVDTSNDAVAPGGAITGSTLPYRAPDSSAYADEAEPEVLREWRERRDLALQHRDEVSAGKKAETVKAANEAIDEFYENYNNRKDKQLAQTRKEAEEYLKGREDTTSGGTSWERISKLVDLSGKGNAGGAQGTGKAKMRELLVSLRKDEKAPGATGV